MNSNNILKFKNYFFTLRSLSRYIDFTCLLFKIILPLWQFQAIEKGTLLDLISETEAFKNHRVMASILSAILKMSPVKQLLARDQVKSIYLDRLLRVKK